MILRGGGIWVDFSPIRSGSEESSRNDNIKVKLPPPILINEKTMSENNTENQYVVFARKYRPQNFDDLLGQDALVQTLTNAIKSNRLHHAYILTGIRGVGKTTTARIIAKALNCIGLDGKGGPTAHPCGVCENCVAITNDRHMDVIELDAASRTGVDDIREILDGVRYKPTSARYKIYIIDEVHMLSKSAFNALLKTLEEPPAHVKFIFATTEIRKVPVTILSRCQRFDLQRLTTDELLKLFNKILSAENSKAEPEALHIIAKAADGSARDGLSLLDQAFSLSNGKINIETVRDMIGLADRNQVFELLEYLFSGNIDDVLRNIALQYKNGASPLILLQDLVSTVHLLAKTKIIPVFINDNSLTEGEKEFCQKHSGISIAILSKVWQMLLKGISELQYAPVQIDALEMILIRIAYSANMPTPNEILADVKKNSSVSHLAPAQPQAATNITKKCDVISINSIEDLLERLEKDKKGILAYSIKNDVSISEFDNGKIKMTISDKCSSDFVLNLRKSLEEYTGQSWIIEVLRGALGQTISDNEKQKIEDDIKSATELPLVKAILQEFRGSKIDSAIKKCFVDEEVKDSEQGFEEEIFIEEI